MVLNELKSKTKELVFHRLCPRRCHVGSPIDGIEQVTHCKLLGIIVQDTFSVDMHVNYILSICSQRIFLADRTNGRAIATLLRLSSSVVVVCDVMYCG